MASQRQIEANRRNASRSTGPKTAAGRTASSQNSRSHGLYTDPPAELVLAIYGLIVDNPAAQIPRRFSSRFEQVSLQLAEAEAQLCLARRADADYAEKCEAALRHRAAGASREAKPIHRAAKKMRQLSQKRLDRAMCGDISAVPTESLLIYGPHWRSMKRAGFYDEGCNKLTPTVGLMLFSDDAIFAVDNAGRGKLPHYNLRLRTQLEGKRARALAAWLLASAAEKQSPPKASSLERLG